MNFVAMELAVASAAVQTTGQLNPNGQHVGRLFPLAEMTEANSIFQKLKENVSKDERGEEVFEDGEIDFSTAEKTLLIKLLSERQWSVLDAEFVLSLIEKLQ